VSVRIAFPLPECGLCEDPTRRDVHTRTGGFCTACARKLGIAPTEDDGGAPTERIVPLHAVTDETLTVEGYRPPVPPRRPR